MPKLSDSLIAALVCPAGKKDVLFFDGELPGFGVRVTASGKCVFLFQYRGATGVRRMVLGTFGAGLNTRQARAKAHVRLGEVRDGRDPEGERRNTRQAAVVAHAAAKVVTAKAAFTLGNLISEWETRHLAGRRESYRRDAVGRLRLHLSGQLDRPAGEITRDHAVQELDRIAGAAGETTARRVMGYARSAYRWTRKRGAVAVNPFEGLPPIGQEIRRDRVLTPAEVHAIWAATAGLPPVHGAFVRLLLLTLGRREEVARMRWTEVTPDMSMWTLPASRAKNARAHQVPLSEAAREVLRSVPRLDPEGLVFATGAGRGLTTFSYMVRQVQARSGTSGWRLHDFRRTGVTRLAEMGFPPHVCDRLLNHLTGAIQGVAAVYQRAEFLAERKAALEAWAEHVQHSVSRLSE